MLDEDDGPFSAIKSSIDQLQQRDENLVSNDFLYKDMLTVDHNIAVMREVMTDEELARGIIEVADEELQEEDNEDTDGTLTKPMTEEICKAIDTLVNFCMFTESGKIGTIAMEASTLFEKELCEPMKQQSISKFFLKKVLYTIVNVILYVNFLRKI